MREFLFAPRFHYVALGAFMCLGVYVTENHTPTWASFLLGGLFGILNNLTKVED